LERFKRNELGRVAERCFLVYRKGFVEENWRPLVEIEVGVFGLKLGN